MDDELSLGSLSLSRSDARIYTHMDAIYTLNALTVLNEK